MPVQIKAAVTAVILFLAICSFAGPAPSPEEAFARAMKGLQARDFEAARVAIQQCLKLSPDYPRAKSLAAEIESEIGLALASREQFAAAAEHFRAVISYEPGFTAGYYNLGLALLNLGDAAGAEKAFREVLKLDPKHINARTHLANALLIQARTDRTRAASAAEALRQAIRLSPENAELHFNLAYALALLGDDAGALTEYREVARWEPRFPDVEPSLGYTLYRLSEWAEAERHFRAALAQGYDDYALHFYLGSTLMKTGDAAGAREHLERAAHLDPEQPGAHFQLAAVYRSTGDQSRAAAELNLFRELSAKQEQKWRAKALESLAKAALERGNLAQGIQALTQAFKDHPNAETARNLALAYLQKGEPARARALLEQALAFEPKDSAVYNYLGLLESREGNLSLAANHFARAAQLDPSQVEAVYNAGVAALELGQNDAAIRYFEQALQRSDEPRFHQALALALSEAGRHKEAQKHFDRAQKHP